MAEQLSPSSAICLDVMFYLAKSFLDPKTLRSLRCTCSEYYSSIPAFLTHGPPLNRYKQYQWKKFICWLCLKPGDLECHSQWKKHPMNSSGDVIDCLDFDKKTLCWYGYKERRGETSENPYFCNSCLRSGRFNEEYIEYIVVRDRLWKNIHFNRLWATSNSQCDDHIRVQHVTDRPDEDLCRALLSQNVTICLPLAPLHQKLAHHKIMFLTDAYCQNCCFGIENVLADEVNREDERFGTALQRCPFCLKMFHLGYAYSRCKYHWGKHIFECPKRPPQAQSQSKICRVCLTNTGITRYNLKEKGDLCDSCHWTVYKIQCKYCSKYTYPEYFYMEHEHCFDCCEDCPCCSHQSDHPSDFDDDDDDDN